MEGWSYPSTPTSHHAATFDYDSPWSNTTTSTDGWGYYPSIDSPPPRHDVPLDLIFRNVPATIWHYEILPKLDTKTLMSILVALEPHTASISAKDSLQFACFRESIENHHLPMSIRRGSLEKLMSSCKRYFPSSSEYHRVLAKRARETSTKYRTRSGSGEKRRLEELDERHTKSRKKTSGREFNSFEWYLSDNNEKLELVLLEKMVAQVFCELHLDQSKYPLLTQNLTSFILEAPESMGLVFLSDQKIVLPDSFAEPCKNLPEYVAEVTKNFRDMYTISSLVLKVIYSFETREVRVRLVDPANISDPELPADVDSLDLFADEEWDEEFWDEQASWESPKFWNSLVNKPSVDSKVLMANGMCSKMDLSSAIYHAPTHTIELFALENIQTFYHFSDEFEVDWRFVGYAVMGARNSIHTEKVTLSMYDYYESHRSHARDPYLGYKKMVQELHFCNEIEQIKLTGFAIEQAKAIELFDSLPKLQKIIVSNQTFHRCVLLPAKTQFPESRKVYNLRQNVRSRQNKERRSTTF